MSKGGMSASERRSAGMVLMLRAMVIKAGGRVELTPDELLSGNMGWLEVTQTSETDGKAVLIFHAEAEKHGTT